MDEEEMRLEMVEFLKNQELMRDAECVYEDRVRIDAVIAENVWIDTSNTTRH